MREIRMEWYTCFARKRRSQLGLASYLNEWFSKALTKLRNVKISRSILLSSPATSSWLFSSVEEWHCSDDKRNWVDCWTKSRRVCRSGKRAVCTCRGLQGPAKPPASSKRSTVSRCTAGRPVMPASNWPCLSLVLSCLVSVCVSSLS